jgi:5-formyltetrahydrofolate cyclo-ligase
MTDDRRGFRAQFRKARNAFSPSARHEREQSIANHLSRYPPVADAVSVALYLAGDGEVDLAPWAHDAWQRGQALALPCIGTDAAMEFRTYTPSTKLAPNRFDIPQPVDSPVVEDFECALAPLVAFDDNGTRLGMGGGFYDRYFGEHDIRLIGVAFACQRSARPLPRDSWDVRLDAIVTEIGIVEF